MSFPWERRRGTAADSMHAFGELWKGFLRGGYPELAAQPDRDTSLWHASYIQTYLERDVRTLRQVGDLIQYQNFLRDEAMPGYVVHPGDTRLPLGDGVAALPFADL